jgi:hypothetical protein
MKNLYTCTLKKKLIFGILTDAEHLNCCRNLLQLYKMLPKKCVKNSVVSVNTIVHLHL